ncbi:MAG: hypothetical protein ABS46_11525 [Cytophagaceae bacterium SCN 52-12]|nr:MAG: hypothetical protein ABS46_11525 [Cytophagaceae bacterium SCN 52-12]
MNILSIFDLLHEQCYQFLLTLRFTDNSAKIFNILLLSILILCLSWLIDKLVNLVLTKSLRSFRSERLQPFFTALINNQVVRKTGHLIPLIVFYNAVPGIFRHFPQLTPPTLGFVNILIILLIAGIFKKVFRSVTDIAETRPGFRDKPLESYHQVVSLLLNFIALILIFSQVTGKEVWTFFTAMGAMSAVLMLVFKDTIMGFVASVQVTTNDMVRIGDWVEMPKYGADGDVTEITLNTVKVQNFDKTITTIPTYALIADSFKNWRGMSETGARRIKRAVNIKMSSVRFLQDEELEKYRHIQLLAPVLTERQREIEAYNNSLKADKQIPINGRHLTNLGLFRQYLTEYLRKHPKLNKQLTSMVRQLAPADTGIPLELYVFTATTVWVEYEGIMADIFDHVIAAAPYFDLEIFEQPTGKDLGSMLKNAVSPSH